jgi:hypothetical protein
MVITSSDDGSFVEQQTQTMCDASSQSWALPGTPGLGAADAVQQAHAPATGAAPLAHMCGACHWTVGRRHRPRRHCCGCSMLRWRLAAASCICARCCACGCRQTQCMVAAPTTGHCAPHQWVACAAAHTAAAARPAAQCHASFITQLGSDSGSEHRPKLMGNLGKILQGAISTSMTACECTTCKRCTRGRGRPALAAGSCGGSCGGRSRHMPTARSANLLASLQNKHTSNDDNIQALRAETPAKEGHASQGCHPSSCGLCHMYVC